MKTITVKEFASMPEAERAILTYEKLSNIETDISSLVDDMKTVKKCVEDGKLSDGEAGNSIKKAQATADSATQIGELANKRIDKIIWAVAATLISMIITVGAAVIIFLLQRGLTL